MLRHANRTKPFHGLVVVCSSGSANNDWAANPGHHIVLASRRHKTYAAAYTYIQCCHVGGNMAPLPVQNHHIPRHLQQLHRRTLRRHTIMGAFCMGTHWPARSGIICLNCITHQSPGTFTAVTARLVVAVLLGAWTAQLPCKPTSLPCLPLQACLAASKHATPLGREWHREKLRWTAMLYNHS